MSAQFLSLQQNFFETAQHTEAKLWCRLNAKKKTKATLWQLLVFFRLPWSHFFPLLLCLKINYVGSDLFSIYSSSVMPGALNINSGWGRAIQSSKHTLSLHKFSEMYTRTLCRIFSKMTQLFVLLPQSQH